MLTRTIKYLFNISSIFVCILIINTAAKAQENDTLKVQLELGKRNHFILNRKISFYNMGKYSTPFSKVFFRESTFDNYKSIGFLGTRIKPYFINNPKALKEFKKFRMAKIGSYISIAAAPIVAIAWIASSAKYARQFRFASRSKGLVLVPNDSYYYFPTSIVGLCVISTLLNQNAEHHLILANELISGRMKKTPPSK